MIAAGSAPCKGLEEYEALAGRISQRFLRKLSRDVWEQFRPLLDETENE